MEADLLPAVVAEPTRRGELRRLVRLAWPVVLAYLGMVAMGTVDTLMAGRLGADVLGAIALGNIWMFSGSVLAMGAARALDPVVSQAFGAGNRRAAGMGLSRGFAMGFVLAPPVMGLLLLAEPGLGLLGQPPELLPVAGDYCRALIAGIPFLVQFGILRQFLQGLGVMRPATAAVLAANFLNVGLNWVLMYGKLGFPALGAVGCGISTSVCQVFLLGALLWLSRGVLRLYWPGWAGAFDRRPLARLLALGIPLGFQVALEAWAFYAAGLLVGRLGPVPLAAHAIALNLAVVAFTLPFGLSAAAATRVGNLMGAGLPWRRPAWLAVAAGAVVMLVPASLFTLAPGFLSRLYTRELEVLAIAVTLLPLAGMFQLFDGVQVVAFGVLRGAGDVHVPTAANIVGYWVLGLPAGWWLAFEAGWGPRGVWAGLAVALAVVAILLLLRIAWVARRGGLRVALETGP